MIDIISLFSSVRVISNNNEEAICRISAYMRNYCVSRQRVKSPKNHPQVYMRHAPEQHPTTELIDGKLDHTAE